jgi:S1-C subfamily serine protease
MSGHFGVGPWGDEHLAEEPGLPSTPGDGAPGREPEDADRWTAAAPSTPGENEDPATAEVPRTAEAPSALVQHEARRRWRLVGASLAVFGLAMGSAGYLLGDRSASPSTPSAASPFYNGLPFTVPGFGNSSGGGGSAAPGFGNNFGGGGVSTSSTVPAAVKASESALVDVNTTIDNGQATGAGTGIVLGSSGIVLTNNHVVDGATSISVTDLGNGQTYQANVLGYDVQGDVALLQLIGASGLTAATIGSPATVGQTVYAVGNAGGTGGTPTVTSGSITGTDKSVTASDEFNGTSETVSGMLSTSAALISGDSGGALTSGSGTVVGVDTAGSSTAQGDAGGFAIPIATALGIAHEIESNASSSTVHVGATAMLGVGITERAATDGASVVSVLSGQPAAAAGITAGSRITSLGGQPVTSGAGLRTVLFSLHVGERVTVQWIDAAGAHHTASVTLASGPSQ